MPFEIRDYSFALHSRGGHEVVYQSADRDEALATRYYGFVTNDGSWILLEDDSVAETTKFVVGTTNYADAWTHRKDGTFTYKYFHLLGIL